ncbi:hypothetical protein Sme01_28420 [Sphaerisporangium melleum]|uniref:Uncharacterized protein n=1 Tax=Sphaerisporangium melleum TaxID=321316 RepID=A0A917R2D9_9ACTN|nr:hypothetical protein GCM10007964_28190 [Sphaerisporangium melleum]GII70366.1 hypothetical protein Sme01_28420 [Sphaerisporangium melleum]
MRTRVAPKRADTARAGDPEIPAATVPRGPGKGGRPEASGRELVVSDVQATGLATASRVKAAPAGPTGLVTAMTGEGVRTSVMIRAIDRTAVRNVALQAAVRDSVGTSAKTGATVRAAPSTTGVAAATGQSVRSIARTVRDAPSTAVTGPSGHSTGTIALSAPSTAMTIVVARAGIARMGAVTVLRAAA